MVMQSQDDQDKLMILLETGATVASASGAAGKTGEPEGLRTDPEEARRSAAAVADPEHFILSIASCRVHEERPDPRRATATLDQQRYSKSCFQIAT